MNKLYNELKIYKRHANPCSYGQFYYELLVRQLLGLLGLFLHHPWGKRHSTMIFIKLKAIKVILEFMFY